MGSLGGISVWLKGKTGRTTMRNPSESSGLEFFFLGLFEVVGEDWVPGRQMAQ